MTGIDFDPWGKTASSYAGAASPWDHQPEEPPPEMPTPTTPPWLRAVDEPAEGPPDDEPAEETPGGYWDRLVQGDAFLLDVEPDPDPLWGRGPEVLWSPGEPAIITGPIGAGKTTLLGHLVRGRLGLVAEVLGFPVRPGDRRVLYLACDRPRQIRRNLARMVRVDERPVLADALRFWTGPPPTDLAKTPSFLLDMCRKAEADTVILDGLKDVALELSKDDVGAGLNQAFQRCVAEGIEVIGNHHQRKNSNGNATKPRTLADMYGSTWIGAGAGTVLLAWVDAPGQAVVEVSTLKPAREPVGPLSVMHDLDTGALTVMDAPNVETVLQATSSALSITEIADALGKSSTTESDREQIRRSLRRLLKSGVVDVLERPSPYGRRPEKLYLWSPS